MTPADLTLTLRQADALRQASRWQEALDQYAQAEPHVQGPGMAAVSHNMAVCLLALGETARAIACCEAALACNGALWQSELVKAKALKAEGKQDASLVLMASLLKRFPANPDIRLEMASTALHELGDAALADKLVAPVKANTAYRADATLTSLMARLYDRTESAEVFSRELCAYADSTLTLTGHAPLPPATGLNTNRRRIGLISSHFNCSPVYFFCIGALRHLVGEFDLVVFQRGRKTDWATQAFRDIASAWHDVAGMDSDRLAIFLKRQNLDVLIDLGGWMDAAALRALSTRPARRLYKWVGGQSATTGLRVFDGMFSDEHQTPLGLQPLYSEPLILLKSGYVTYTAPDYLPAAASQARASDGLTLGVISNPAKVSGAFLSTLGQRLAADADCATRSLSLRFIDKRYRHEPLRRRVSASLRLGEHALPANVRIEFVVPKDHPAYLKEVAQLDSVIDTFPYTGGLTTMEALALGVPCRTRVGKLFSERHTYAHCRYAGLDEKDFELDAWKVGQTQQRHHGVAASLIDPASKRLDHAALAGEMARHFLAS